MDFQSFFHKVIFQMVRAVEDGVENDNNSCKDGELTVVAYFMIKYLKLIHRHNLVDLK